MDVVGAGARVHSRCGVRSDVRGPRKAALVRRRSGGEPPSVIGTAAVMGPSRRPIDLADRPTGLPTSLSSSPVIGRRPRSRRRETRVSRRFLNRPGLISGNHPPPDPGCNSSSNRGDDPRRISGVNRRVLASDNFLDGLALVDPPGRSRPGSLAGSAACSHAPGVASRLGRLRRTTLRVADLGTPEADQELLRPWES